MKILKSLLIIFLGMALITSAAVLAINRPPLLSQIIIQKQFNPLSLIYSLMTSFIISLNPTVSPNAYKSWFILIFIGWMNFCFFSRWTGIQRYGITRKQIFFSPFLGAVLFLILNFVQSVLTQSSPILAKLIHYPLDFILVLAFVVFGLISILSIPISLIVLAIGSIKSIRNLLQGHANNKNFLQFPARRAMLPRPIVKRIEIDGIKYDV